MSEITRCAIGIPFEMAMGSDLSRRQFHSISQALLTERDNLKAEVAGLRTGYEAYEQVNADLKAEVERLRADKDRLDAIEGNCWDVRFDSSPNGDAGDSNIIIEIVGHWMDKPFERVVGENYNENLRAAIDQAMKAPTYPPARPEYPEIDAAMGQGERS